MNFSGKTVSLPATNDCRIDLSWNSLLNVKGKNNIANIGNFTIKRYDTITKDSVTVPGMDPIAKDGDYGYDLQSNGLIPGYKYRYVLYPKPKNNYFPDTVFIGTIPNGAISGSIKNIGDVGVPGVEVCAVRIGTVPQQDKNEKYCSVTDLYGNFKIDQIYYYDTSEFKLVPRFKNHGFKLKKDLIFSENKFKLTQGKGDNIVNNITFVDTSSMIIYGSVIQPGFENSCNRGIKNVKIKLYRGTSLISETLTIENGLFKFNIDTGGIYTIVPKYYNHHFSEDSFNVEILADTTINPIIDTTNYILSGYIYGACNKYFGKATLKIYDGKNENESCLNTTISTNNKGYYEVLLPANYYTIDVISFNSTDSRINSSQVAEYFADTSIDLTRSNVSHNFVYRDTLTLKLSGLEETMCNGNKYPPILKQDNTYAALIEVFDRFGDSTCLADTGFVNIKDYTGYSDIDTTLMLKEGKVKYIFKPGFPNLNYNHQKQMTFSATVEKENDLKTVNLIVEGAKPLKNTFVTTSPEIPLFVLHDPPGDNSYSYLQKNTISNISISNIRHEVKTIKGGSGELKICPTFVTDFGPVEFSASIGWGRTDHTNLDSVKSRQNESILEMIHKQEYQTSSDPSLTGSKGGDVYIGGALNLIYAETKQIYFDYNTCQIVSDYDIFMLPHSLATDFVYSENQIRNYLIPELDRLEKYYEKEGLDTAVFFKDQKNIWLAALANNKRNLSDHSTFLKRISFDGGAGAITNETTHSTTKRNTFEFHSVFDSVATRYWKAEVAGIGFQKSKVLCKIQLETGTNSSYTSATDTTTGFVLKDDDAGDKFMVDVYNDNVYGTPAFNLISGNSSCPYEKGTRPREGVQLTADKYVAMVNEPDGTASFKLQISNTGETNEDREYNLLFHQGSNPDGAKITLGGSQIQAGIPIPYKIHSWGSNEATVTVQRGPEAFDYSKLMFTLESGCDDNQIVDTLLLDVHFKNTCGNFFISKPAEKWIISSGSNGQLPITLGGYDKSLFTGISLQVCRENDHENWNSIKYIASGDLSSEQTKLNLELGNLMDGNYELRAKLECNSGKLYTEPIKGKKDTYGPDYFGVPEPADNILHTGDVIQVLFNETINTKAFSVANVKCINTKNGSVLPCNAGCNNNEIIIYPNFPLEVNSNDTYQIFVAGLEDLYGNIMDDTVSWSFTVNNKPVYSLEADADGDTIKNRIDNCPFTNNPDQKDTDKDGIGDICDEDIDGDGILNKNDNCPNTPNPGQEDIDGDGFGDACDLDMDGDMIPNSIDNNSKVYNPFQTLGIKNHISEIKVVLQPNPVKEILQIHFSEKDAKQIEIKNAIGKVVYISKNIDYPVTEINVSSLKPGFYFVQIIDKSGNSKTLKFVKE